MTASFATPEGVLHTYPLHTCTNTATTCDGSIPPSCRACQEDFENKSCTHEGRPCPTKDGTPFGDVGGCPCDHCYPRTRGVTFWNRPAPVLSVPTTLVVEDGFFKVDS
jgi:hypothetical protein